MGGTTSGALASSNTNRSTTLATIVVTVSVRLLHLCADGVIAARTGKYAKNVAEEWHDYRESREVIVVSGRGTVEEPAQ